MFLLILFYSLNTNHGIFNFSPVHYGKVPLSLCSCDNELNLWTVSESNQDRIMENKLFRMAVEFGVTEGMCLLKNMYINIGGGVNPGAEIIAPIVFFSSEVLICSIYPPLLSMMMRKENAKIVFIKAAVGSLLGEALGLLLFDNSDSPFSYYGSENLTHLIPCFFSVIAINL
ncbi:hypothetical protein DRQ23_05155 [bacterium]|nr:MAG: hypothetical protein DRQ23_05155 [bacterium]